MRLRFFAFLPLFLCSAFFFRLFALNFSIPHSQVAAVHCSLVFKRKPLIKFRRGDAETATEYLKKKTYKKNKAIRTKRQITLLNFFVCLITFAASSPNDKSNFLPSFKDNSPAPLPRYLALSVLRI